MKLEIPTSLRLEHEELHQGLAAAMREPGELGEAAQLVARLLEPHVRREESFALPPLALLEPLAQGDFTSDMDEVLAQSDWMKENLPTMLAEHRMILAGVEKMLAAARAADRVEYAELAERIIDHARMEEQVLYPAAILVGKYIRARLAKRRQQIYGSV